MDQDFMDRQYVGSVQFCLFLYKKDCFSTFNCLDQTLKFGFPSNQSNLSRIRYYPSTDCSFKIYKLLEFKTQKDAIKRPFLLCFWCNFILVSFPFSLFNIFPQWSLDIFYKSWKVSNPRHKKVKDNERK